MNTQLAAEAPPGTAQARDASARLLDIILTTDDKQRRCLTVLLLASLITIVGIGLIGVGAVLGLFERRPVAVLSLLSVGTMAMFYAVIRSGLNREFPDPTLAYPQTIAAQTLTAAGYAVLAPVHSALLILLLVVLVFGMFNMRAAAVRAVCLYTVTLMGLVMAWCAWTNPRHYPPELEIFNFVMLATVLAAVSTLAGQLMNMRLRLKTQKVALEEALAQIGELATRDELTGLPNRRHLTDLLQEHAARRARGGPPFFVGLVDLDHFKRINDAHGHAVGDEALRCFSAQAKQALRNTDVVGRWGGEEFLLILPGNVPDEPEIALERLRCALSATAACPTAPAVRVEFSCGLTRYRDGETTCQTVERADKALYRAKSAGRGRTVVA